MAAVVRRFRNPASRLAAISRPPRPDLPARLWAAVGRLADRRPRTTAAGCAAISAAGGWAAAGPVLAAVAAVYAGAAAALVLRHRGAVAARAAEVSAIDTVSELIGELRSGAPVSAIRPVMAAPWFDTVPMVGRAVTAAVRVSEQAGAPLADTLDRVDAQLRQAAQIRQSAAAHAAGTRATAFLLAVLPAGGIGLGYAMGADPLALLLRTPFGAACTGIACLLQIAGLVWTDRLSRVDTG